MRFDMICEANGIEHRLTKPNHPWSLEDQKTVQWTVFPTTGYCESFNARFRDELLDAEVFYSLREAQILIERWRRYYNTVRPHSSLGYRPPAPGAVIPIDQQPTMH